MTDSRRRGNAGEAFARGMLQSMGYRVLEQNFHSRYGEVDLIASKDGYICFVEVKTRRWDSEVTGPEAVTPAKQNRIIKTALQYLEQFQEQDLQPRFDLFSVAVGTDGGILEYDYITGAFDDEFYDG